MTAASPSEQDLIQRSTTGDSDAFGALVQPHLGLFYNGVLRILGNEADAEDALQDALISIHRDLPRFEGRSRFSSWGYRICLNAALMVRRSRVRIRDMERPDPLPLGPFDERGRLVDGHAVERLAVYEGDHVAGLDPRRFCR